MNTAFLPVEPGATSRVPLPAVYLGAAGAIPFVALAFDLQVSGLLVESQARLALGAYGASILAFLGGIQWGFESVLADGKTGGRALSGVRLLISIVPSVIAAVALLMGAREALLVLAAGFALAFLADWWRASRALSPGWFMKLRAPLSAVVIASLLVGA